MNYFIKLQILFLFLFTPFCSHSQAIDWDSVIDDYVTKYQPQQMPAWLFPIVFEEAGGERDTVYIGYDPDAVDFGIGPDSVFGEYWLHPDTSSFFAYIAYFDINNVTKAAVFNDTESFGANVDFHKGHMPLKMYFNVEFFYMDTLPFITIDSSESAPYAMGTMWCSDPDPAFNNCDNDIPYHLTDDPLGFFDLFPYVVMDSIVLAGLWTTPAMSLNIDIIPYVSFTSIIDGNIHSSTELDIYPNPSSKFIHIEQPASKPYALWIYNSQGIEIAGNQALIATEETVRVSYLKTGLYFIRIIQANTIYLKKIIIH
jgi:hypothetical protein